MLRNKRAGPGSGGLFFTLALAWLGWCASFAQGQQPLAAGTKLETPNEPARPDKQLQRPLESTPAPLEPSALPAPEVLLKTFVDPPLGFTGPSGIRPRESQETSHFVPIEDRWRIGFPAWDRYDKGHPLLDDYPYVEGHWWDPFNQNVFKGDYPIIGQHTFLDIKATSLAVF